MLEIKELKAPPSLELFSELVELLQDAVSATLSLRPALSNSAGSDERPLKLKV